MCSAHQCNTGDVEGEGRASVEGHGGDARLPDVVDPEVSGLGEQHENEVGDGADGSVVVQACQRVHLGGPVLVQQALHENQAQRLEDDAGHLQQEADPVEVDLAKAGHGHAQHDDHHVQRLAQRRLFDPPEHRNQEDGNGRGRLPG